MNRKMFFVTLALVLCLAGTWLEASAAGNVLPATAQATLSIPAGLTGTPGDTLAVPVFLSTPRIINQMQIVVEFDNKDFTFIGAALGPDASGFFVSQIINQFPIPLQAPGATENVLVKISTLGLQTLSGNDRHVLTLHFKVAGNAGASSPFAFASDTTATFLTTDSFTSLHGADLQFNNGSGNITSLATLSIPGGFSVPKAETLKVPISLSSTKPIGVLQMVLDYDGRDLKFLSAAPGPDAEGFSLFVETSPRYTPVTNGTNTNLLITLLSGSDGLSGSDITALTLNFEALGEIGGNSPLAFDRRDQHTVLSTIELIDLTGADLSFRDGDATILPPLVRLAGKISYRSSATAVSKANVAIIGQTNAVATTDTAGDYLFGRIAQGSYILRPLKEDDVRDGIQASDALMVLRAVSLLDTLTADQRRTAEVTGDGRLTNSDVLAILRYLSNQTTGTGEVGKWIFQPDSKTMLVQSDTTQNFQAFLLGDVDGNWTPTALAKTQGLPLASVKFGAWREDGELAYLPLLAGEGQVHTLLASMALPANASAELRFVPAANHIVMANHLDANVWNLALVTIDGIAPEEKIGELVMPRHAANGMHNLQFKSAVVNDRLQKVQDRNDATATPESFSLQPNYPNPFNPSTWIAFGIPANAGETEVRLEIFSLDGRLVRSLLRDKYAPGNHRVQWNGRDDVGAIVPTGVYFYRLQAGSFVASRKLVMVK